MDPLAPLITAVHTEGRLRVWSLVITVFGDLVQHRGGAVVVGAQMAAHCFSVCRNCAGTDAQGRAIEGSTACSCTGLHASDGGHRGLVGQHVAGPACDAQSHV